jgi:hypothetical protein
MKRMPIERARQEIDDGIASVKAALGDDAAPAPFFRIPGLSRAEIVEDYLASQGIQIWSADFLADDWRHVSSSRVSDLAIKRLEDKGRGVLLLHDIQARTVAALPRILHELKARGYRIVQVVPATSQQPATPTETPQWQLHPPSETVAISHWPKIPNFAFTDAGKLPAPALSGSQWHDENLPRTEPLDAVKHLVQGVPLPAPWPLQSPPPADHAANALPVPGSSVFEIREGLRAAMQGGAPSSRRAELALPADDPGYSRQLARGKRHAGRVHQAGRRSQRAAHARSGTLKHLVQVRKRSV